MDDPVVIKAIIASERSVSLVLMLTIFRLRLLGCDRGSSHAERCASLEDRVNFSVVLVIVLLGFWFCCQAPEEAVRCTEEEVGRNG
jgi:hypothetical protein